jgi:signal transduction histidine kinase
VDLVELVSRTVADFAPASGAVDMRARLDELVVSADPARLRQALENLLSNALKIQPEGRPVVVHVDACEPWAAVTVEDNGPGVPLDAMPHLFQRFGIGPGSVGLGLGLYLARGIIEAHAGALEVNSRPGRGARFTIRLPMEQPDSPNASRVSTQTNGRTA